MVVSAIRDIRIEQGWNLKKGISLAGSPDASSRGKIDSVPFSSDTDIFLQIPIDLPYLKNPNAGELNER